MRRDDCWNARECGVVNVVGEVGNEKYVVGNEMEFQVGNVVGKVCWKEMALLLELLLLSQQSHI